MPKQATRSTKQLATEIDPDVKDRIVERARQEGRTLRSLIERMARHYIATIPVDELDAGEKSGKKSRHSA